MQLPPLIPGRIINRYKRFLADIELEDGRCVTAHCPNTGSMTGCWAPGAPVEISHSDNPRRKLPWTLERVDMGSGWIGINTSRTNAVVEEALQAGCIPPLSGYGIFKREVNFDLPGHARSRLDLMLQGGAGPDALVEVKNVTLLEGDCLRFPDAVSVRALKHLNLLKGITDQGNRGIILFALNRPEGSCFAPAEKVDPDYAECLREVVGQGVEAYALRIRHTAEGMHGEGGVPVVL
ncbi:MAG: DNA/RNA nuclease SfsA [Gammaproteobacteria bacterium]|nr:DNA/RNA nuclease SfsA [Gammaproteobacteria bacterium]